MMLPYDAVGCGDCFFKSVSHQLYGTCLLHLNIRLAGIIHLNNNPQLYAESISETWNSYIQRMSTQGEWCDRIILQPVANVLNCVIHVTESDLNKPEGTIITPVFQEGHVNRIFLGYINGLHYVSTVPDKNSLKELKRTWCKLVKKKEEKLKKKRDATKESRSEKRKDTIPNKKKSSETNNFKDNQNHVMKNIDKFNKYSVHQCIVCQEAWFLKPSSVSQLHSGYQCLRCKRETTTKEIFKRK